MHVAIIMDGNGRWALARGRSRTAGHRAGAQAVRRTVEAARRLGIGTLTLYAFSSDNWRRPTAEVAALMRLFRAYLLSEAERCAANGIRLSVIGRRDRLTTAVLQAIAAAESATSGGSAMRLRIAVDYSGRDTVLRAATSVAGSSILTRDAFAARLAAVSHEVEAAPDVDLLIRTGGERRLSDFSLWELAYAELVFTPRMWPDFTAADLESALREYRSRERRFGTLPEAG